MKKDYEAKYHSLEETNWWFVARRDLIADYLDSFDRGMSILDVGCSGGLLIERLRSMGFSDVAGIDISQAAVTRARKRGLLDVKVMDASKLVFRKKFDIIIASDVLEHIKDDRKAISAWYRALKKGGTLILLVPAFMHLWSTHDVANLHYRRYTLTQLALITQKTGFRIIKSTYWNFLLFFPLTAKVAVMWILGRNRQGTDHLKDMGKTANSILAKLLKIENKLLRRLSFPVGVSVFLVAVK